MVGGRVIPQIGHIYVCVECQATALLPAIQLLSLYGTVNLSLPSSRHDHKRSYLMSNTQPSPVCSLGLSAQILRLLLLTLISWLLLLKRCDLIALAVLLP